MASAVLGRWGWLMPLIVCLLLGYLAVWERGPYRDDYLERQQVVDSRTGQWRSLWSIERYPFFPVRVLRFLVTGTLQAMQPTQELLVRAIVAASSDVSALLLGWLVYRVLESRLAAVTATWLFALPFMASEAVLWLSAVGYVFGTVLVLLFLHAAWCALKRPTGAQRWMGIGTLAFAASLLFFEVFVTAAAFIVFFGLVLAAHQPNGFTWQPLRRALLFTLWPLGAIVVLYVLVFRGNRMAATRGSLETFAAGLSTVAQRVDDYFRNFLYLTVGPSRGLPDAREVFEIGVLTLLGSWWMAALAAVAVLTLALSLQSWRDEPRKRPPPVRHSIAVIGFGMTWWVSTLLIPLLPLQSNFGDSRLVYFPLAGLVVALSALGTVAVRLLGGCVRERLVLGLAGVALLFSTVCMLGYSQAYAARSRLDRQQLSALLRAIPSESLPTGSLLLSLDRDERIFATDYGVAQLLTGVLEMPPWSANPAVQEAYGRPDLHVIASDRALRLERDATPEAALDRVRIEGVEVPLARAVPFSYRDGEVALIERVTVEESSGTEYTLEFPLVQRLRREGRPTLDHLTLHNAPP
jgi:hypothetical protein